MSDPQIPPKIDADIPLSGIQKAKSIISTVLKSYRKNLTILVIVILVLAVPLTLTLVAHNQDIRQRASSSDQVVDHLVFSPGAISLPAVTNTPIRMSVLAYDINNKPLFDYITYSWGISSTNSVGTLESVSGSIATFIPKNLGHGDIFVTTSVGPQHKTQSIPVQIGPTTAIPCGGNSARTVQCPAGYSCQPDPANPRAPFGDIGGICLPVPSSPPTCKLIGVVIMYMDNGKCGIDSFAGAKVTCDDGYTGYTQAGGCVDNPKISDLAKEFCNKRTTCYVPTPPSPLSCNDNSVCPNGYVCGDWHSTGAIGSRSVGTCIPAPSPIVPSITPPSLCKAGINAISVDPTGCNNNTYISAQIGCYDNYVAKVATGKCETYETFKALGTKACDGHTLCKISQAPPYPTPTSSPTQSLICGGNSGLVCPSGNLWAIGTNSIGSGNYGIYQLSKGSWYPVSGAGNTVATGPDGTAWVLNSAGGIYHYVNGAWQAIPGAAHDIAVGADGSVWAIGTNSYGKDYGIFQLVNGNWIQISGAGERIAVAPDGTPWVVNHNGNIYHRAKDGTWQQLSGAARDIAVGADGSVWVIGTNDMGNGNFGIYHLGKGGWETINGSGARITVDHSGNPIVTNAAHEIYYYYKGAWQRFTGAAQDIGI